MLQKYLVVPTSPNVHSPDHKILPSYKVHGKPFFSPQSHSYGIGLLLEIICHISSTLGNSITMYYLCEPFSKKGIIFT